ncbi:MAG: hypothetical protein ACTSRG_17075 [Candidatus Helarchaeota archaeon]
MGENMTAIFDINKKCKKLGISESTLEKIINEVREEFPNDEMMFELHVIRALMTYSNQKKEK